MSEPRKREEKIGPSLRRRRGYVERDERGRKMEWRGGEGVKREESVVVGRDRHKGEEKSVGTVKERVGKDERNGAAGGRQSGTEMEKGKERERERPTPCTCVTVRPRTRRRVLISQRAPRRRASFCEPCFFRRCTARRGAAAEEEMAVVKAGCKECHDLAQQTSPA
ncbi:hypothetical protein ALC62_14464 [Cyphomyrmex costatus]|uniref:Uncharacterized protein n=1 Tax=Cyphomyrmex costatus TaxID=456900 RepID=A0A195C1W8_9HYME|nr:hypothetical protein ALC62_14464 [Cyphomyrmex costatus]